MCTESVGEKDAMDEGKPGGGKVDKDGMGEMKERTNSLQLAKVSEWKFIDWISEDIE